jgi:predicted nucleic acid-binding protein
VETAVLDASVLFRGGVRDVLLWVAEAGAFSPAWSDTIHEEWRRSRRDKLGDPISRLKYARAEMEKAFPGANVDPNPQTLGALSLPDQNDAHVIATALAAQAETIVTYNGRHFPDSILAPLGIRAQMPDAFLARLLSEAQADVVNGARLHRASLKKPPYDPAPYLIHLESLGLARTADLLRAHEDAI